jgi:hypothetical protein
MDSNEDTQQRRRAGQRQGDRRESRPHHGQADSQSGGQSGVIARERPVPDFGAFGNHVGGRAQRPARPFFVDDQLHPFADGIGGHGADPGEHASGDSAGVVAAASGPALPHQ